MHDTSSVKHIHFVCPTLWKNWTKLKQIVGAWLFPRSGVEPWSPWSAVFLVSCSFALTASTFSHALHTKHDVDCVAGFLVKLLLQRVDGSPCLYTRQTLRFLQTPPQVFLADRGDPGMLGTQGLRGLRGPRDPKGPGNRPSTPKQNTQKRHTKRQ